MSISEDLKLLLGQIATIAQDAAECAGQLELTPNSGSSDELCCTPHQLPASLRFQAVDLAVRIRHDNAPSLSQLGEFHGNKEAIDPFLLSLNTTRYWETTRPELTVSFIGDTDRPLQERILKHMNAWNRAGCLEFVRTNGVGDIRISMGPTGNWTFQGTDIKLISHYNATTNFDGISADTEEDEFRAIVQHVAGRLLGFDHQTHREQWKFLDKDKVIRYLKKQLGWPQSVVEQQLFPAHISNEDGAPTIMGWQFPAWLTTNQKRIIGAKSLTGRDRALIRKVYPNQH